MKVGRRLAMKILNAARFALMQAEPRGPITEPLDRGMLTRSSRWSRTTEKLEGYDYARACSSARKRSSGPSATTTSSWSRRGATAISAPSCGVGQQRHAGRAVDAAAAVCALPRRS